MNDMYDYILVGGGLQSGLILCALTHSKPNLRALVIEQNSELAGNHTWSFHPQDISKKSAVWINAIVEYRWPAYEVKLTDFRKQISLEYATLSAQRFREVIANLATKVNTPTESVPGHKLLLGTRVQELQSKSVTLENGEKIGARCVIDCRGPGMQKRFEQTGYQKFWGFEVEIDRDWPSSIPTVMDDSTDQSDGFRFIYSLPFEPRRVLIEDTRFSNTPDIIREECLEKATRYAESRGVQVRAIVREEHGILPMPISLSDLPHAAPVLAGGYAGGWFHSATGYSFPLAVAFADAITGVEPEFAHEAIQRLAVEHKSRAKFGRFLNRLLFYLVEPKKRYQIFRRFYKVLSTESISRFYAHQFTAWDAARIVIGMPPGGLQPWHFTQSFFSTKRSV